MELGKLLRVNSAMAEGYISPRLQELSAYYSNRLSYEEVEKLVEKWWSQAGDQKIGQIVSDKAENWAKRCNNKWEQLYLKLSHMS